MILSIFAAIFLQAGTSFWSYWGDGKSEINRYETIQNRYGEERKTEEILIYVTEPFNLKKQVKSDSYDFENKNHAQVLKLNHIKDFQTGLYDYNLMTSVFAAVDPFKLNDTKYNKGEVIKVNFTGQDWCGHVFHQLNRLQEGMRSVHYSYFESEGDETQILSLKNNTMFSDHLFIAVRELINDLPEGEIDLYPSLEFIRLFHKPMESYTSTIKKSADIFQNNGNEVPVHVFSISNKLFNWKFIIEKEYPKKILYYEFSFNDVIITKSKLVKSVRLPYWQLNKKGDEKYLKQLGY